MKKFIRFFTALAVFVFIFTACGGKGNQEKPEISDGDEIPDDEPEPDGTEKFVTKAYPNPGDRKYQEDPDIIYPENDDCYMRNYHADTKINRAARTVSSINRLSRCRNSLCATKFRYDPSSSPSYQTLNLYEYKTGEITWQSSEMEFSYYDELGFVKNNNLSYFCSSNGDDYNLEKPIIRLIKFKENDTFEEIQTVSETKFICPRKVAISNNNIVSGKIMLIDAYSYPYKEESFMLFFDMNNLNSSPIRETKVKFYYYDGHVDTGKNIFVIGNTFWTSGCTVKNVMEDGNEYYCYAIPFDVNNAADFEEGVKINIPGGLVGTSNNGEYFYSKTPSNIKYSEECGNYTLEECRSKTESYNFYILKINPDKTEAEIVMKYRILDSSLLVHTDRGTDRDKISTEIYIKNDKVFVVKKIVRTRVRNCEKEFYSTFEVKLFSAISGKELLSESFPENAEIGNVEEGGILVLSNTNLYYISENGKQQLLSDNYLMPAFHTNNPLLFNGRLYLTVDGENLISFDVK